VSHSVVCFLKVLPGDVIGVLDPSGCIPQVAVSGAQPSYHVFDVNLWTVSSSSFDVPITGITVVGSTASVSLSIPVCLTLLFMFNLFLIFFTWIFGHLI